MRRRVSAARPHARTGPVEDAHEPLPEGDEWVYAGGDLIWAAGSTSGGVPYGIGIDQWRRELRAELSNADWVRARDVLEELARRQSSPASTIEIGRVVKVGAGLSRLVFAAELSVMPDESALSGHYAVLLPGSDPSPGLDHRVRAELRVLHALHGYALPFRVPRPLGALPERHGLALAREFMPGIPLDLRAGRMMSVRPWQVVAEIAAALHAIRPPIEPARGNQTRRDHALEAIAVLDQLDGPVAALARAWALENLPLAEPATLVHGDLLGQNILLDPSTSPVAAVIDWEYTRTGDPAYDLAIVTRGVRRPFQIDGGFERLLDAYQAASAGGPRILKEHVRIHELALAATWYKNALDGLEASEPPEQALGRLQRILRMAIEGSRPPPS